MATFTESGIELYPITVRRYEQMVERGILGKGDKVELLRGVLAAMSPHGDPHLAAIQLLNAAFAPRIDWTRFTVQIQLPVSLPSLDSVPEPDVAIIAAPPPTDRRQLPALVIEVSDSSLGHDLRIKSGIYAEAGIPEFWVIDVRAPAVRVDRDPSGSRYLEISAHTSGELVSLTDGIPPIDVGALLAAISS